MSSAGESPRIARGALVVLAGSTTAAATAFVTRVVMARSLGPADLGVVTLAVGIASASGAVAALGTNAAAAHHVSARRACGDEGGARAAARTALRLAATTGLAAAALLFVLASGYAGAVFAAPLGSVLAPLAILAATLAVGTALLGVSRGFGDVWGRALVRETAGAALRLTGVLVAVARSAGPRGMALGFAAGSLLGEGGFLGYAVARGWLRRPVERAGGDRALLADLPPYATASVLVQAAQWSDLLLLGALAAPPVVGIYGVARGCERMLEIVSEAAGHRFLPAASAAVASRGATALWPLYRRTRALVWALVLPGAATLLVAPVPLLAALFGATYVGAATPLRWLVGALLLSIACGYDDKALLALGEARWVSRAYAAGVVAGAAAALLFIPRFGATGAALAFAALVATQNAVLTARLARHGVAVGRQLGPLLLWGGLPVALAAAVARAADWNANARLGVVFSAAVFGSIVVLARYVAQEPAEPEEPAS